MNFLVLYVFAVLNTAAGVPADNISYPQNYFISPIDLPITLAGNFGEPRTSHFHTGLDIRTNQEEGHKVFAAADGYISRINVSSGGYGNALYITHPNGYVTVYGHLQQFSAAIQQRLRTEQYAKKSFSVDFSLKKTELPVKKGQVIALSGNSGGSGGPHLHFEIRDSLEWPLNPLLFGYNLKDNIKPVVNSLKFYAEDEFKNKLDAYRAQTLLKDGEYGLADAKTVNINASKVGIAVNTFDGLNLTDNRVGIYSMKMYDGEKLVYEYRINKFSFADKRYILSHVDYPVFMAEGRKAFHKCFIEPGNKCPVYSNVVGQGMIDLADAKKHEVKIEVSDYAGNISVVKFSMQYDKKSVLLKEKTLNYTTKFTYDKENEFSNADMKLKVPLGCLFDDVFFSYGAIPSADTKIFSKLHNVDKTSTRTFDWATLSIKTENLKPALADKAIIIHKNESGGAEACGGKYENGFITTRIREFGTYYVRIDTTAPTISPINIKPARMMRAYKQVLVRISDNLSGIAKFDTYMDGEWVLTDHDGKSSMLTHTLNPKLSPGSHTFKVVVTDERKNTSEYSVKFKM